jgi:cardiolipin synthase
MVVLDGCCVLLGSARWDLRSLHLNFEFNVEVYEPKQGARMTELFEDRRPWASEITISDVRGRSLPVRLRDGIARLFSPYL